MVRILQHWHIDPVIIIVLTVAAVGYWYYGRRYSSNKNKAICFYAGLLLLASGTCFPVHFPGMQYIFSIHMITHMTVLLLAAPLLVAGIPEKIPSPYIRILRAVSRQLSVHPWTGWITGIGIMWFWHIPAVFDAVLQMHGTGSMWLSYVHWSSLLAAGILFCWPVLGPFEQYRLPAPAGVLYLASACVGCSLLGLLITFAPPGIYHLPVTAHHGISSYVDQQTAGLIMWVPGCIIYLAGSMYLLRRWFAEGSGEWLNG